MTWLHSGMSYLDGMTPFQVATYLLIAWVLLLVLAMVRWLVWFLRYTPDNQVKLPTDPRRQKTPPRAAGLKRENRKVS